MKSRRTLVYGIALLATIDAAGAAWLAIEWSERHGAQAPGEGPRPEMRSTAPQGLAPLRVPVAREPQRNPAQGSGIGRTGG